MKIGNIVYNGRIDVPSEINVVSKMEETIPGIPTLIVGYDFVNKNYPNFDITDIKLGENLYWTFKRNERRDKFEEDVNWFIWKCYQVSIERVSYVFVDIIQYNRKTITKIVKKILSLNKPISYLYQKRLYIYGENLIFGVDLSLLDYVGMSIDSILIKAKKKSHIFLEGDAVLDEYRSIMSLLENKIRYIPLFYSIKNS